MLIIKRKAQDIITIAPHEEMDLSRPISDLFENGVIEIKMLEVGRRQVKVAIDAPAQLQIWRGRRDPLPQAAAENDAQEVADDGERERVGEFAANATSG